MKKLSFNFLLMMGLMASLFFSCNGEDDTPVGPVSPTITSISPSSAEVGDTITINGTNLATATVSFGTTGATVLSPTATSLEVIVPQLTPGEYDVRATVDGNAATSATKFTVTPAATASETIAAIASGNNDLSVLVAALQKAELVATLDGTTEYTVFAPTNDAFTAAGIVPADVSKEDLAAVLQDHVVTGIKRAADLKNGDRLTALSGKILPVTVNGTIITVGEATVTSSAAASNGVVHIINAIVKPEITVIDPAQAPRESLAAYLGSDFTGNLIENPMLGGVASTAGGLNPIPTAANVTTRIAAYPDDAFFTKATYKGAFDPAATTTWLDGWSLLSRSGILSTGTAQGTNGAAYDPSTATIVDVPASIIEDATWTSDNVYRISGYTFVQNNVTLTIQPGTVVIATPQTGEQAEASALIITSNAMISAEGTAESPIIFTSSLDDGQLLPTDAGQWGGLVVLGTAPAQAGNATADIQIEGIESDAGNSTYGGQDAADNSGTLKYVSIRHTGDILGNGNEVQGLTLGGVGSGTTIEYVESIGSSDDGVEIFGGTVSIKHFAVAYQEDDAFDFDQGWKGNGQFLFSLAIPGSAGADDTQSDHAGEWDGFDEGNSETALTSSFTIYNATFVGAGQESSRSDEAPAILVRENAEVTLANSIITNYDGKAIDIQDLAETETGDSFAKFKDGKIDLLGNIFFVNPAYTDFSSGATGIVVGGE